MTTQEALEHLSHRGCDNCAEALAIVKSAVEERDALKEQRDDAVIRAGRLQQDVASLKADWLNLRELAKTYKELAEKAEAEVEELKDDLLDARGDSASDKAQADSFAKLCGEAKAEVKRLKEDYEYKNEQLGAALIRAEKAKAEVERLRSEVTKTAKSGDRESQSADEWATKFMKAEAEVEQCRVQLAGCGVAALGYNDKPAKQGDYGWSQSYQDVLNIRADLERARPLLEAVDRAFAVAIKRDIERDKAKEDFSLCEMSQSILEAALAYKEAKETRAGDSLFSHVPVPREPAPSPGPTDADERAFQCGLTSLFQAADLACSDHGAAPEWDEAEIRSRLATHKEAKEKP